ncbi:MAG: hypothetical protein QM765_12665 [Myxococcales bacterium]
MSARQEPRGHLLIEAMVASSVLLVSLVAVLGAVARPQRDLGNAEADEEAWHVVRQLYEQQRAAPLEAAAWTVGTRTGTHPSRDVAPWTWSITITAVSDGAVAGVASPLKYRRADIALSYRGRVAKVEAVQW